MHSLFTGINRASVTEATRQSNQPDFINFIFIEIGSRRCRYVGQISNVFWKCYSESNRILRLYYRMKHQCSRCLQSFAWKSGLSRHQRVMHEGVRYQCEFCSKRFTQTGTLNRHRKSVHEKKLDAKEVREMLPNQCPQCLKMLATKSSLRRHQNHIHDGICYQCEFCSKRFTQTSTLNRHLKNIHGIESATMKEDGRAREKYEGCTLRTIGSIDQANPNETEMSANTTATDTGLTQQSSARNETDDLVDDKLMHNSECEIATKAGHVQRMDENGSYQIKIEEEFGGVLFRMLVKWTTFCTECDTKFNIDDDKFCRNCGTRRQPTEGVLLRMPVNLAPFCSECGTKFNTAEDDFCRTCATRRQLLWNGYKQFIVIKFLIVDRVWMIAIKLSARSDKGLTTFRRFNYSLNNF